MIASTRPPDRICTVPGPRGKTWTVWVYWNDHPAPDAWERAEKAIVRFLLPKAREPLAPTTEGA